MIKKYLICLILLISCKGFAQLADSLKLVRQQHDLMGGVVTVFCADRVVYQVPFGLSDVDRGIPVTDSTLFRIASISKTVTAMAVMKLVEDSLLQLDQDISSILGYTVRNPDFPDQAITPRMLLSHQSSIVDGDTYSEFLTASFQDSLPPNLATLLTPDRILYSKSLFLHHAPGTYFTYSNLNFVILGTLIEKASRQRFDTYCREKFFQPMGLKADFNVENLENMHHLAVLYRRNKDGNWEAQADQFRGIRPTPRPLKGYMPGTNGALFGPQGGLRCNGADLSKIFMLLLNEGTCNGQRLLSPSSVQLMVGEAWSFNGANGNHYGNLFHSWGLGIHRVLGIPGADMVLPDSPIMYGHPGEAYGLFSDAYIDPIRKIGIVFMTNGCGEGEKTVPNSAFYAVEKHVFDIIAPYTGSLRCTSH
ncbi:MAG TPA: hypothetical protein DCF33_13555 [Saprospirales bacterium]|nr:hypothetical protein [Saprospirales bacterium]